MRLSKEYQNIIKEKFKEFFNDGDIYLFGSRVDDTKRGGDIDLYICPANQLDDERALKREFSIKLDEYIDEQKIDIIIAKDKNRLIEQVALRDGVVL